MPLRLGDLQLISELVEKARSRLPKKAEATAEVLDELKDRLGVLYRDAVRRGEKISKGHAANSATRKAARQFLFSPHGGGHPEIIIGLEAAALKAKMTEGNLSYYLSRDKGAFYRTIDGVQTEIIDLKKWPDGALPPDHFKKKYKPVEEDPWDRRKAEQDFLRD